MRFLKTCIPLLFCLIVAVAKAQDTATIAKDSIAVFHADKAAGIVALYERAVPETTLQHLRNDEAFWYANHEFKKKAEGAETRGASFWQWLFRQEWFYNLLWTLIVVSFIIVMIVFLVKSKVSLFHKKTTPIAGSAEAAWQEDIFTINYEEALKTARAESNYRLAVRLHYLQALALLSRKNLIQYKEDFTNRDYLLQVQQREYYGVFKKLTRHFEYAWYGKFVITPAAFNAIETDFTSFKSSMDS